MSYYDDGHTQRLKISGKTGNYTVKILHDDRKPLSRWLNNQAAYSQKEADMLLETTSGLSFTSRLRKTKVLAPVFIFFYCLFIKGMIWNGWRGWHYTLQRTLAEILVSMRLAEDKIKKGKKNKMAIKDLTLFLLTNLPIYMEELSNLLHVYAREQPMPVHTLKFLRNHCQWRIRAGCSARQRIYGRRRKSNLLQKDI